MPERGFALLIVLWTVILVSTIALHVLAAARQRTQLASNLTIAAALESAADGGIYTGIFHALDKGTGHWGPDGLLHAEADGFARLDIRITGEAGKLNLNKAQPELLAALLRETGTPGALADRITAEIVNWRSPPGQAPDFDQAYRGAGLPYLPPRAPFESVQELGLLLDMTPAILAGVSPYLTLYHDGDVDPGLAATPIRLALRDVFGQVPPAAAGLDESVLAITAVARHGEAQAERRAVVSLHPDHAGHQFHILEWRDSP